MVKPRKVTKRKTFYLQTCTRCGTEFKVDKDDNETMCYDCSTAVANEKAISDGQFIIGAEVIAFEPHYQGNWTNIDELDSLTVKAKDGRIIKFGSGGYDERYIDWEEVKDK
jgi:DNA-directed RNA polymerase subunit RPC12/RpoP